MKPKSLKRRRSTKKRTVRKSKRHSKKRSRVSRKRRSYRRMKAGAIRSDLITQYQQICRNKIDDLNEQCARDNNQTCLNGAAMLWDLIPAYEKLRNKGYSPEKLQEEVQVISGNCDALTKTLSGTKMLKPQFQEFRCTPPGPNETDPCGSDTMFCKRQPGKMYGVCKPRLISTFRTGQANLGVRSQPKKPTGFAKFKTFFGKK